MRRGEVRRVYFAFEYEKDAHRRSQFLSQAQRHCGFRLEDLSLPSAVHGSSWQREALKRIQMSHVVLVLLGPDTHNAPGVRDELSLAGQARRPVVQLMPKSQKYGLVSHEAPVCPYRWRRINEMLDDPNGYSRRVDDLRST